MGGIKGKESRDIYKVKSTELSDQLGGGEIEESKITYYTFTSHHNYLHVFVILLQQQSLDHIL